MREVKRRDIRQPLHADIRLTDSADNYAELTIIDISRSGVGIDGLLHFKPETAVRVDFPNGFSRVGKTRWRDTFTSGVAFDEPMTFDELDALERALAVQSHFAAKVPPKA